MILENSKIKIFKKTDILSTRFKTGALFFILEKHGNIKRQFMTKYAVRTLKTCKNWSGFETRFWLCRGVLKEDLRKVLKGVFCFFVILVGRKGGNLRVKSTKTDRC